MRKFGRKKGQRRSFLKTLAHNLIMNGKITTTEARAKEIRPIVERLVSVAKKQQLSGYRYLLARLPKESAGKLYHELASKYRERKGGFLRIIKISGQRKRDGAVKTIIEFV